MLIDSTLKKVDSYVGNREKPRTKMVYTVASSRKAPGNPGSRA